MTETPKRNIDHCQHCGGEVAKDAPTCIHCGSPTPHRKKDRFEEQRLIARVLWPVLILIFLVVVIYEICVSLLW